MTNGVTVQAQSPGTAHADLGFWLQSQIIGQPMAMREENLSALVEAIAANRFSLPRNRATGARITEKGTAIIEIHGVLINRAPVIGSFWGLTAYEGLGEQFRRIATNADIKRVVLDLNSPGGLASGIRACADELEALAGKKPVLAIAHDMACSAGYWLGSIAEEFSVTPDGDVGSIGVRAGHVSYAELLDRAGIDIRLFGAGAAKNDYAISKLLSDGAAAEIQYGIDREYDRFIAHVARHRPLSEQEVRDTDARCFVGQEAVEAGLADRVETLEALIERIEKDAARLKPRRKAKADQRSKGGLAPAPRTPGPQSVPEDEPAVAKPSFARTGRASSRGDRTVSEANQPGAERPGTNYDAVIAAALTQMAANGGKAAPAAQQKAEGEAEASAEKPSAADVKARIKAIKGCEAAKERPGLAEFLAIETDIDAKLCEAILKAAPAEAKAEDGKNGLGNALDRQMQKPGNAAGVKPEAGGEQGRKSFSAWVKEQPGSKKTA